MNTLHLTLDELSQLNNFKSACGIYQIKPSLSYIISTLYKNINIFQNGCIITVDGELHKKVFDFFNEQCGLSKNGHQIIFSFEDEIELKKKLTLLKFSKQQHVLPKPKNNKLYFEFYSEDLDLDLEFTILKQYLKRLFPDNPFTVSYTTKYSFDYVKFYALDFKIDEDLFWKKMFSEIHGDIFKFSSKFKTISFDFKTEEELNMKLTVIKAIPEIDVYDRKEYQKFKIIEGELLMVS